MGLKTTAVKLVLGLAALDNRRRCGSLTLAAAAAAASEKMKSNKEKSIYLCFVDRGGGGLCAKQIVRAIPWNDGDEAETTQKMTGITQMRYTCNYNMDSCTTFGGSLILFPSGLRFLHTCCLDTSTLPLKFRTFSYRSTYANGLTTRRHQVRLGEVDGKLYRIDNHLERFHFDPYSCAFQVFDPEGGGGGGYKWSPLSTPPFIHSQWGRFGALFLDAAKKVIGWDNDHYPREERQMFCFDTTKPEIGWTYLERDLPLYVFDGKPFLVHHRNPHLGDFHIIFQYNPRTLHVSALFMSNDFHTIRPINTNIHLPAWCSDSILSESYFADFEFVHLGAQRIALVLHRYVNEDEEGGVKPGSVLVIAFEYEIITTTGSTLEIKTRLFRTRRFQYQYYTRHFCMPGTSEDVRLNGAFLL